MSRRSAGSGRPAGPRAGSATRPSARWTRARGRMRVDARLHRQELRRDVVRAGRHGRPVVVARHEEPERVLASPASAAAPRGRATAAGPPARTRSPGPGCAAANVRACARRSAAVTGAVELAEHGDVRRVERAPGRSATARGTPSSRTGRGRRPRRRRGRRSRTAARARAGCGRRSPPVASAERGDRVVGQRRPAVERREVAQPDQPGHVRPGPARRPAAPRRPSSPDRSAPRRRWSKPTVRPISSSSRSRSVRASSSDGADPLDPSRAGR